MPGVVAGTLLAFIPAAGDYVNASLLGNNTNTTMIGQVIDARFFKVLDYPTAASLSVVLMVAILVLVGRVHPTLRDGGPPVTAVLDRAGESTTVPTPERSPRRPRRRARRLIVPVFAALAFVYLLVPVAYTVVFSFNDAGKTNLVWQGFTLDELAEPLRCAAGVRGVRQLPAGRRRLDADRDRARHAGGDRAGPVPVPRARARPTC